jgi:hypothetical protein
VYLRDTQAGATTLVSRASGPSGAKGDGDSAGPTVSADGRFVSFRSAADNLAAGDTDTGWDVYVRDLQGASTTLVSRAGGASGAKGHGTSFLSQVSADGSRVAFSSVATGLSPDDTDALSDVYVRDLQANTTTLVSRAGGASGAKGQRDSFLSAISSDGARVAFFSSASNLAADGDTTEQAYVRDLPTSLTTLESRASPGYVRPRGADWFSAPLVTAFPACTSPDRVHAPPLAGGSCSAPATTSQYLTLGTPDVNGTNANGFGFIKYHVLIGNPSTAQDEADLDMALTMVDVRNRAGLGDYAGELRASLELKIADRANGPSSLEGATVSQVYDLAFAVPCIPTPETSVGSSCSGGTTADAVLPGLVKEGKRAVWDTDRVRVYDGGSDGLAATTGDNTLFLVQGLFAP